MIPPSPPIVLYPTCRSISLLHYITCVALRYPFVHSLSIVLIRDVLTQLQSGIEALEVTFVEIYLYEKETLLDSVTDLLDVSLIF